MSPMSFGTPAAKKKRSRRRDPMELSPTFRSKNYKSVLSKKNGQSIEPAPFSISDCNVPSKEKSQEVSLRKVLLDKITESNSEEEDEYF